MSIVFYMNHKKIRYNAETGFKVKVFKENI